MKAVLNKTIDYYQRHTDDFAEQTVNVDMQDLYEAFINDLPEQDSQHILDVGCGSGRDAAYFATLGYQVTAIDASANLLEWAKRHYSLEVINWQHMAFDGVADKLRHHRFSGIWASASLLHLDFDNLATTINSLLALLSDAGVLYASFKYGAGEREDNDRYFCDMNEERWAKIESDIYTNIEASIWIKADKRPHRDEKWLNVIIKKLLDYN